MILRRYVAGLMAGLFLLLSFSVVMLFVVIDLGDWLRYYIGKPVADVVALYWYRSHVVFVQLAPAALVLAAGLTITIIRRRGEWTALRALGASPAVVVGPIAFVATVTVLFVVGFQEIVVSRSGPKHDLLMVQSFNRWGDFVAVYSPKRWFRVGDALLNIRGEAKDNELQQVRYFELNRDAQLVRWIEGERLRFVGGDQWEVEGGTELHFSGPMVSVGREGTFDLSLRLPREVTNLAVGRPEWLPLTVLSEQLPVMQTLKLPTEPIQFALHSRWASALAALVAALFACQLGQRSQRKPSVPQALVQGALLFAALFVGTMASRSLALSGRLPPALAAWSVPFVLLVMLVGTWAQMRRQLEPMARRYS